MPQARALRPPRWRCRTAPALCAASSPATTAACSRLWAMLWRTTAARLRRCAGSLQTQWRLTQVGGSSSSSQAFARGGIALDWPCLEHVAPAERTASASVQLLVHSSCSSPAAAATAHCSLQTQSAVACSFLGLQQPAFTYQSVMCACCSCVCSDLQRRFLGPGERGLPGLDPGQEALGRRHRAVHPVQALRQGHRGV